MFLYNFKTPNIYINVPFLEKDEAKNLGAKWDGEKKSWYYTNPADASKFAKWRVNEAMKLEDLSDEQQKLIELAKAGDNVLVDACIGSGKTTAIQVLCNELAYKKILYLTYNTLLKVDARDKIKAKNVTVTNYHGFAFSCLKKAKINVGISDLVQTFIKEKDRIKVPKYDLLVLDEYQDIEQELAELLDIIKEHNPNLQIVAVGDMEQKIYDKTTLEVLPFINDFLGDHQILSFTKCFRLSAELASRLGSVWNKEINGVNPNCTVDTMSISQVTEYLSKQKTSDVLCLGSRTGIMSKVLNHLEKEFPDKYNKETVYASISDDESVGRTLPNKNTAIFTTYDSSKGLERRICVVFDYTENYWYQRNNYADNKYEILRNIFLVAMSRGKEHIIVVQPADSKDAILTDSVLAEPITGTDRFAPSFRVSEMFDFKYKEDIEECYRLIKRKKSRKHTDNNVIDICSNDCLIDLSPCIGIYQEASYFKNYNIDEQLCDVMEARKLEGRSYIRTEKKIEEMSVQEKVLLLTAYETNQERYIRQVKTPFITEADADLLHERLQTKFKKTENVQQPCSLSFNATTFVVEKGQVKRNIIGYDIIGRCDVLKNDVVYELKFVSELTHEHFLQCACYVVLMGLEKGVLWNVRNDEEYIVTVPDRKKFIEAVMRTITKRVTINNEVSLKSKSLIEDPLRSVS